MSVPDRLHDEVVQDLIRVLRYEAGLSKRVLAHLRGLEKDILGELAHAGDITSQRKLQALLKEARQAIADRFDGAQGEMDELPKFASLQAENAVAALNGVIGVDIAEMTLTSEQIKAIASDVLVEGAPSAEWWSLQADELLRRFKNSIRMGMTNGWTGDQMAGEVRDLMGTTMRNAQSLVRTSVLTVNNATHLAVYEANADIVQGIQWVSTLDGRTTPTCRALDGARWKYPDMEPMDGFDFPGPTAHWGCRSTQIPWLKPWEDLFGTFGKKMDEVPPGTRASMDGQVSAKHTYESWLKTKPSAFQEEVLGPARYRLWKDGKLSLADMVNQHGHELTLAQLGAR